MKQDIHPDYVECEVSCGCGESFTTHATVKSIRVEVCSKCHPFYTGKQKLVDSTGRVERFNRRWGQHIQERMAELSGQNQESEASEETQAEAAEE